MLKENGKLIFYMAGSESIENDKMLSKEHFNAHKIEYVISALIGAGFESPRVKTMESKNEKGMIFNTKKIRPTIAST